MHSAWSGTYMSQTSVKQLASEVGIPVDRLVSRLAEAGLDARGPDDLLSDDDKLSLLRHLSASKGSAAGKGKSRRGSVSLRRRSTSELKVNTGRGSSSGRTVNVEVRKRRTYVNRQQQAEEEARQQAAQAAAREAEAAAAEEKRKQEEAERAESEKRAAEAQEAKRKQEEAERLKAEEKARREAEKEAARNAREQAREQAMERQRAKRDTVVDAARSRARENLRRAAESHGRTEEDAQHENTVKQEKDSKRGQDQGKRKELHVAEGKKGRRKSKKSRSGRNRSVSVGTDHGFERPTAPVVRDIEIPELITVSDLAQRMAVKGGDLIKRMMKLGVMATINQ